ncbi:hypothetical protein ISS08_00380 [Candidatus Pacearchaeota archaeon]|nr:hypothetical protein [Candidatus Pacearchaeota archaeon]
MWLNQNRKFAIKKSILTKPYIFSFIIIFLAYLLLNFFLNDFKTTLPTLFTSFKAWFLIPFVFFNFLLIPFLIALTINLTAIKFQDWKSINSKGEEGLGILGVFGGILGGACPGCFAGFFPAFIGIFGISATLSSLPLYGLELQFISAAFLITAIVLLTRPTVCKIDLNLENGK